ncbi:hypothetical protein NIES932_05440 [Raphidiopsis curvata NIES-932]|nr:hypothetical protein NIES932_05440 [Raphidiopsis curvata NIES-932]
MNSLSQVRPEKGLSVTGSLLPQDKVPYEQ